MVKVIDRVQIITPHMPAPGFAQLCDACLENTEGLTPRPSLLGQDMASGSDFEGCATMAMPLSPEDIGPHECLLAPQGDSLTE